MLHSIVFDEITVEVQFAVSLVTFEFVEPPLGVVNLLDVIKELPKLFDVVIELDPVCCDELLALFVVVAVVVFVIAVMALTGNIGLAVDDRPLKPMEAGEVIVESFVVVVVDVEPGTVNAQKRGSLIASVSGLQNSKPTPAP